MRRGWKRSLVLSLICVGGLSASEDAAIELATAAHAAPFDASPTTISVELTRTGRIRVRPEEFRFDFPDKSMDDFRRKCGIDSKDEVVAVSLATLLEYLRYGSARFETWAVAHRRAPTKDIAGSKRLAIPLTIRVDARASAAHAAWVMQTGQRARFGEFRFVVRSKSEPPEEHALTMREPDVGGWILGTVAELQLRSDGGKFKAEAGTLGDPPTEFVVYDSCEGAPEVIREFAARAGLKDGIDGLFAGLRLEPDAHFQDAIALLDVAALAGLEDVRWLGLPFPPRDRESSTRVPLPKPE